MSKKLSILVIDDEVSLENVYRTFLTKMGAEVTYFDHPQKGWRAIEKQQFDLIITDLKMPVISGDEFISIVRSSKLNDHTPIILCSGYINKLVITEMARESKIYFLTKPFDSKSLLELVSKALGVKKAEETVNQTFSESWASAFLEKLSHSISDQVQMESIKQFELWNFESISLSFVVTNNNEQVSVTLLMKLKTFLKVAGFIQGTQYKEIESETLAVWQELLESVYRGTSRITFSKLLSQEIIMADGHRTSFHKYNTTFGEVLVFLN